MGESDNRVLDEVLDPLVPLGIIWGRDLLGETKQAIAQHYARKQQLAELKARRDELKHALQEWETRHLENRIDQLNKLIADKEKE